MTSSLNKSDQNNGPASPRGPVRADGTSNRVVLKRGRQPGWHTWVRTYAHDIEGMLAVASIFVLVFALAMVTPK